MDDPDLVHGHPDHVRPGQPFDRPVVARDRADPVLVQPAERGGADSGLARRHLVDLGEARPVARGADPSEVPGADQERVTLGDRHPLGVERGFEIGDRHLGVGLERGDAAVGGDVDEHPARDHRPGHGHDVVRGGTCSRDGGTRARVVHPAAVEYMRERVPMGGAVHGDRQRVVGVADRAIVDVGPGSRHHVLRVQTAGPGRLRKIAAQLERERVHAARADAARRGEAVSFADQVERATLVIITPPPPVR